MPLTKAEKTKIKSDWDRLIQLAAKFSEDDVETLYVIDTKPLLQGGKVLAELSGKIPQATWTRGKQSHS
jgi:hypothetical protein